jgi:hypothetical protein
MSFFILAVSLFNTCKALSAMLSGSKSWIYSGKISLPAMRFGRLMWPTFTRCFATKKEKGDTL